MDIEFPHEFLVYGTPVSVQARAPSKERWKALVRASSAAAIEASQFSFGGPVSVTLLYFPPDQMQGDIDNIVKLVLDALIGHIYLDDAQVERILAQKFEPGRELPFVAPFPLLAEAIGGDRPVLYVRVSDDPLEEWR